ncbi:MAG: CCA tRNA nucleotidyltransferase, mitochondrial [Pycnora praestabilis]|nr:MAG: CCA tRNA nucleotidyltransferase, mitochondrial [Pycnora praestabilis]
MSSLMVQSNPHGHGIQLTPVESTLRQLLLDVADHIDRLPAPETSDSEVALPEGLSTPKVELRFTGGWVRDKLLGVDSHDIDVAINKMTGYQFGLKMKSYLELSGNLEKYGIAKQITHGLEDPDGGQSTAKRALLGGLHKIEANPEKSKHLETVTTKILGLDIDLVNLRKETYSEESRNPQMEFGTPEEDALRRDATVNAMFYNLHTSSIEDFTGQGFNDMERKIIRTPLEPHQTFTDDPLRVLRLIRFASRLGFKIDPKAETSMNDVDVKSALRAKISRERVGTEVEKMLKGPDPHRALNLIDRLNLYNTIFTDPASPEPIQASTDTWKQAYDCVGAIFTNNASKPMEAPLPQDIIKSSIARDSEDIHMAWLLAALTPWADVPAPVVPSSSNKISQPLAACIAREGLKINNKAYEIIINAFRHAEEVTALKNALVEQKRTFSSSIRSADTTLTRDTLGMAIRRWGAQWRFHALLALLLESTALQGTKTEQHHIFDGFASFFAYVNDLNLSEAYLLKPPLDGKRLARALDVKPGVWMKDTLDAVMAWQLRNPHQSISNGRIEETESLKIAIIEHILNNVVRPAFETSRNPDVTDEGRKAMQPKRRKHRSSDMEELKPWKSDQPYVLTLLTWVLRNLNETLIEQYWPLVVPPVLTIVDDEASNTKAKGIELLNLLLQITPPSLLARTGLGEVMQDAVMPCLLYLPSLTPEHESLRLLGVAYPALISLVRVRYPTNSQQMISLIRAKPDPDEIRKGKTKLLDQILRKGILNGYRQANEYVKIVELLVQQLGMLVDEMGISSVKHLKDILPMLSDILAAPFGTTYTPLLIAAARTLQTIILTDWPRIANHRGEILRGLTICWCKLEEEDSPLDELETVKFVIKDAARILKAAVADEVDIDADFQALMTADKRLEHLLQFR